MALASACSLPGELKREHTGHSHAGGQPGPRPSAGTPIREPRGPHSHAEAVERARAAAAFNPASAVPSEVVLRGDCARDPYCVPSPRGQAERRLSMQSRSSSGKSRHPALRASNTGPSRANGQPADTRNGAPGGEPDQTSCLKQVPSIWSASL